MLCKHMGKQLFMGGTSASVDCGIQSAPEADQIITVPSCPSPVKHAANDREPQKCLKPPKVILAITLVPDKHYFPFLFPSILSVYICTPNNHP